MPSFVPIRRYLSMLAPAARQVLGVVIACAALCPLVHAAPTIPEAVLNQLARGQSADVLIEFSAPGVESTLLKRRQQRHLSHDDPALLAERATLYRAIKARAEAGLDARTAPLIEDYAHLPMVRRRFADRVSLELYRQRPGVAAIYANLPLHAVDATSYALVQQPPVQAANLQGAGTTMVMIDDGIDYTNSAFGSCTAPGTPAGCQVVVSQLAGTATGTTDNSHGTNVSAIALGMAPRSQIAMLNAFSGTEASSNDVVSAIEWAIANQATYNIVAINMSLGDGSAHATVCYSGNPFATPLQVAYTNGILPIAAAGNDANAKGINAPACSPNTVSVGAVYDANYGGLEWGDNLCTDATTAANQITCFSDSAPILTLLAPGALITAAGIQLGGTSQASPHVTGALTVLRAAFPNESLATSVARLTSNGVAITDARNGLTFARLDLLPAARPANDNFANRITLSGASGSVSGSNVLATEESGEPLPSGDAGGNSVWWSWTAPAAGQVTLDTHGSSFDTVLGVYTGTTVGNLSLLAANDNDGSSGDNSGLLFEAVAGQTYQVVVEGASTAGNAASGTINLDWALNTNPIANVSVLLSGASTVGAATQTTLTLGASNNGPQTATNVVVSLSLPSGVSLASIPGNCSQSANLLSCALGSITSGSADTVTLTLVWPGSAGSDALVASVTDAVPNASGTTAATETVTVLNDSASVPLPAWAIGLLAALLCAAMGHQSRARRRS